MSTKIKRGDVVEVISGSTRFKPKEKKRGKVVRVYPEKGKVLVEQINMIYFL
jgi:ribosomal protein L24